MQLSRICRGDGLFCAAAVGNPGWCGGDEFVKACHVWSPWGERGGIVVKKPRRSGGGGQAYAFGGGNSGQSRSSRAGWSGVAGKYTSCFG